VAICYEVDVLARRRSSTGLTVAGIQTGKAFRRFRDRLGLKQDEMAARLGMGTSTYRAWERGEYELRSGQIKEFAQAFEVGEHLFATELGFCPPDAGDVHVAECADILRMIESRRPGEVETFLRWFRNSADIMTKSPDPE
jgi:transcriptional regulator with XRE-family HTH domain